MKPLPIPRPDPTSEVPPLSPGTLRCRPLRAWDQSPLYACTAPRTPIVIIKEQGLDLPPGGADAWPGLPNNDDETTLDSRLHSFRNARLGWLTWGGALRPGTGEVRNSRGIQATSCHTQQLEHVSLTTGSGDREKNLGSIQRGSLPTLMSEVSKLLSK